MPRSNLTEKKSKSPEEICRDSGKKWCGYTPKIEIETLELDQSSNCVGLLEMCPVRFPPINPKELVQYCKGLHGNDPLLCSRASVNLTLPPPPAPEIEEVEKPPPPAPFVYPKPVLEKKGEICRPGGFCPDGDCPDFYEKTSDDFCAPGPDAPRPAPPDPNHICVGGQWCPPGYTCPPGFELKVAGRDGFCFDKTRQGPTIEPDFIGSQFVAM